MSDFINALTSSVTPTALWGTLSDAAPIITVMLLFAFGYFVLKRVIRGIGHGKARI